MAKRFKARDCRHPVDPADLDLEIHSSPGSTDHYYEARCPRCHAIVGEEWTDEPEKIRERLKFKLGRA